MKIAYLVNQYPAISHSFIRREIIALETLGISIDRFSIRSYPGKLMDEADKQELEKTQIVLQTGVVGLLLSLLQVALTRPIRWFKALQLTLNIGQQSERGVAIHLAYLAEACLLLNRFLALDISHIHAHFGTNSTTVAMLCHLLGGPPYSFTVHGPEEFDKSRAIALSEKIERAAFVVAISSFGKSQLYRWCEYPQWSKIELVRCGVDRMFLNGNQQPISKEPRLVCVGRLSEQKGQLLLIEAAKQLATEGLVFKLVLVGDGPLRSQIEASITQFHLQDKVEITGWASNTEVQQQILSARAMVLPSFAEGLPVVIMESLALGRPVISTYIAGIPELVESGVCGWLIPAGSIDALATAMRTALLTSIEKLEQMGRLGSERVAKYHDVTQEAKKMATLFQREINPERQQFI
jgi:colanic acid/amylovoran biosynthesis glycosyltransferase